MCVVYVQWMNESLKNMLRLPYLRTIHSLQKRDEDLYLEIINLKSSETKIATARTEKSTFKMLLSATAFQTEGKVFRLIAFQNVDEALDETESRAWQKLLGVMTHEIMNSIAPISSLAHTLKNRLQEANASFMPQNLPDWNELGVAQQNEDILVTHNIREMQKIMNDYVGIVRSSSCPRARACSRARRAPSSPCRSSPGRSCRRAPLRWR